MIYLQYFSVAREKFNQEDNDKDDTFSFDLWSTYQFRPDLTAPLTGDENFVMLNNVLVVLFIFNYFVQNPILILTFGI